MFTESAHLVGNGIANVGWHIYHYNSKQWPSQTINNISAQSVNSNPGNVGALQYNTIIV